MDIYACLERTRLELISVERRIRLELLQKLNDLTAKEMGK
jgi:hypothetical protein